MIDQKDLINLRFHAWQELQIMPTLKNSFIGKLFFLQKLACWCWINTTCRYTLIYIPNCHLLNRLLQHKPLDTMYKIEDFLNLSHFTYPESILRSVSHNSNLLKEFAFTNNRSMGMLRSSLPTHLNESDHEIHRPYSFDDKPLLLRLSRSIFAPSLCLFEKLFGWSIHIITESEMPKP